MIAVTVHSLIKTLAGASAARRCVCGSEYKADTRTRRHNLGSVNNSVSLSLLLPLDSTPNEFRRRRLDSGFN